MEERDGRGGFSQSTIYESRESDGLFEHTDRKGLSGTRSVGDSEHRDSLSDVIEDKYEKYF